MSKQDTGEPVPPEPDLDRADDLFWTVFHASPLAMMVSRLEDGTYLEVNDTFTEMTGFSREEAVGRTSLAVAAWVDPSERQAMADALRATGAVANWESRFLNKAGEVRRGRFSAQLVDYKGERCVFVMAQDVEERRRAQEELARSAAELRALVSSMSDVILILNAEGRYLKIPASNPSLLYRPAEEIIGKTIREVFPKDQADFFVEQIRTALDTGETVQVEYSLEIGGEEIWFTGAVSPMTEDQVVWVARDITPRKRAETELRESEQWLRAIFDTAFDGLAISEGGVLLEANDAFAHMFGYTREELAGKPVAEVVAPESRDTVIEHMRAGYEQPYEARCIKKDGVEFPVEAVGGAISYHGRTARVSFVRDLTARKKAEDALRESEASLRVLVENLPGVLWTTDTDLVITSSEGSALAAFDLRPGQAVGRPLTEFLGSEDPESLPFKMHMRALQGESSSYDIEFVGRSWQTHIEPLRDDRGEIAGTIGLTLDVSETKQAQEEVQRYATELEQRLEELRRTHEERRELLARLVRAQEEERRRIASDIHDDSIQKMAAVGLRLENLKRQVSEDDVASRVVRQIEDTVQLSIERLRHLMFELWPPALDRHGLAVAVQNELEQSKSATTLDYSLDNQVSGEPPVDTRTIAYRIIQEAVTNVRKHAGAKRVDVSLATRDGGVWAQVRDDGKGLAQERTDESPPGHLGLSAMRERAEMAGGWLRVEGKPGSGTTVEFWLPVGSDEEVEA